MHRIRDLRGLFGVFALSLAATSPALTQVGASTLAVEGRSNGNPSIATRGRYVAVTWSAATLSAMDVFASMSADGGLTFSAPVRVNDVAGDARVNSELPPRIVLTGSSSSAPNPVVVWTTKGPDGTRLLSARSLDGGRHFAASRVVPGSDGAGSRGWQSIGVNAAGRVMVLWLDHRETVASGGMHHHDSTASAAETAAMPKADPAARASLSKLYFSSLDAATATTITGGVCYCCKTALAVSGANVYAAWRHVYPGSQRDIAFATSRNFGRSFSEPVRVSDDGWHIDGCPENGPAMAVDGNRRIHVAWPAPPDGQSATPLALFYATSDDGIHFAPRSRISTRGAVSHVQLTVSPAGVPIIAWDEIRGGTRHVGLARGRGTTSGRPTFIPLLPPSEAPDQGWPVLATGSAGVVIAWVSGSGLRSTIRVASLP